MPFLKKTWMQSRVFLDQLPLDTKFLIVSLVVILALVGFLAVQWAGSPDMTSLPQVAVDRQQAVMQRLKGAGIDADIRGGAITVPQDRQDEALAVLAQFDLLSPNTSAAFEQMIANRSPWLSDRQNKQSWNVAKMDVLSQVVSKMVGVRSADVIIDFPPDQGFARTHVRPSASVNVIMSGSARVTRRLADAITGLVAGATPPMQPRDVVVVDANIGKQFKGKGPDDSSPGEQMEYQQKREQMCRDKIEGHLSAYIPGVSVAVNVRTDPMVDKRTRTWAYDKDQPLTREQIRKEESSSADRSGETGVRPNAGMTIAGGGGSTTTEKVTDSTVEMGPKSLTQEATARFMGNTVQQISVSIGVPRPYFVGLYMQKNPAGGEEVEPPDDVALKPLIDEEIQSIIADVKPLVNTAEGEGVVHARMIPDLSTVLAGLNPSSRPQGVMQLVGHDLAKPIGLGMLALLSMGIMFFMVRKANQRPELPTVQELAGLPPDLPTDDDLIGEAIEEEAAMAGVEIGEGELQSRRMAEQISELIKANPSEAGTLVGKWVETDE